MGALQKIRLSGFAVTLVDGFIEISPASRLTEIQLEYLKAHKAEIIAELKAKTATLTETERQLISAWVRSFGGSDTEIQEETAAVIEQCQNDAEALAFFLKRATDYCTVRRARMLDDLPRHCEDFITNRKPAPTTGLFEHFT